jgi:hypothetical protein
VTAAVIDAGTVEGAVEAGLSAVAVGAEVDAGAVAADDPEASSEEVSASDAAGFGGAPPQATSTRSEQAGRIDERIGERMAKEPSAPRPVGARPVFQPS